VIVKRAGIAVVLLATLWAVGPSSVRASVPAFGLLHSFSGGLGGHNPNSTLIQGDVVQEITKLKQQDGPELQVNGSANLIQTLLKHDLVDELWLKLFPITLGMGKRLFAEGTIAAAFTLREAKTSPSGVIVASYERAGDVQTGSSPSSVHLGFP